MRPLVLNPFFKPLTSLPGIGPRLAGLFDRLLGPQSGEAIVRDLLFHLPHSVIDRSQRPSLDHLPESGVVTVDVVVDEHQPGPKGTRAPYRVVVRDATGAPGFLTLVFFHAKPDWLLKSLPVGERRIVSGRIEWFDLRPQIVHPDHVASPDDADALPAIEPVYPTSEGLSQKVIAKAERAALALLPPDLPEWLRADLARLHRWPDFAAALRAVHRPESAGDLAPESPARRRLAYDELLSSQLALLLIRRAQRRRRARPFPVDEAGFAATIAALPFAPTPSQAAAIADIRRDLSRDQAMLRLLQGDVGSGKTLVAVAAMAIVAGAGAQAALMAPTDLLARQHFATVAPLLERMGIMAVYVSGKDKERERSAALAAIEDGRAAVAVGTHALFQGDVRFRDLGLVVVDEQHRFGVHQRLALSEKAEGAAPHMLVMTATPIPRTLVLSYFGDMDVSLLREKPKGRQPIATRTVSLDRLGDVVDSVARAVARGEKIYWVCPLVSESDVLDVAAAEERAGALRAVLGERVLLVHGKMPIAEKDAAMRRFREKGGAVLVATTVIEVGVDVPEATVIVIEHAERFGLAQLHQLRGRVGRGTRPSTCLLLFKPPLGETAKARLSTMRDTEDGFVIAEKDLELRGEGDILGTRQSGAPGFRIARPDVDSDLLKIAHDDARLFIHEDADLKSERAAALRHLLYLFSRDDAVRLMRSG